LSDNIKVTLIEGTKLEIEEKLKEYGIEHFDYYINNAQNEPTALSDAQDNFNDFNNNINKEDINLVEMDKNLETVVEDVMLQGIY
jgi:hypothetical protein